jgi:metallo-beta-lactamase family protein
VVNIFGEPCEVHAQIATLDAYSGHADRRELSAYVRRLTGKIRRITVVHGEEEQSLAFAETLRVLRPDAEVIVPHPRQVIDFE